MVCELIGGVEPARDLLLRALGSGKSVVTGNKELLAAHGEEFAAADEAGGDLYFEAAVAGGIPLIRPLRESLAGERVDRVLGIVNGTTNFILTQMSSTAGRRNRPWPRRSGSGSPRRIRRPTSRATTPRPSARSSPRWRSGRGSSPATCTERDHPGHPQDFADADRLGYIKLLAIAELDEDEVSVRVHPR